MFELQMDEDMYVPVFHYGGRFQRLPNVKVEEEIPAKCEDPGPRKIRGVDVPDYFCDTRACGNIGPHEIYETFDLGPRKKTGEMFTTVDASNVSMAGITENVMVKVGKLPIPAKFHVIKPTEGEKKSTHQLQADDGRMRGKDPTRRMEAEAKRREMLEEEKKKKKKGAPQRKKKKKKGFNEEAKERAQGRSSKEKKKVVARVKESLRGKASKEGGSSDSAPQPKGKKQKETSYPEKKKKKKKKKPDEGMNKRIQKKKGLDKVKVKHEIKRSNLTRILGELKKILHRHKGADAHLVRNKSKWK
ncbi:hypothetical protein PIB30_041135 [Stylosanthes scabra]|uniref:Uncharacterized protein n=1 Tax=Stylosanthes scabra TaxID=79078 RepID=A0ABU6SER7_9FABA|nr:hypothetical protein [Stylosanthes scabra]